LPLTPGVFFEEPFAGFIGKRGSIILKGKAIASHRITRFCMNGQVHRRALGGVADGVLKPIQEREAQQASIPSEKEEILIGQGLIDTFALGLRKQQARLKNQLLQA
jgi:hypothetical protein